MSNPLLTNTPVVTINGKERNLPRLSLSATFAIVGLIKKAVTPDVIKTIISNQSKDVSDLDRGVIVISELFEVLEDAEEKIYEVLAKILGATPAEVESLALEEIVEIVIAFKDHPDVDFFTKKLPVMLKKMPAAENAMSAMRN